MAEPENDHDSVSSKRPSWFEWLQLLMAFLTAVGAILIPVFILWATLTFTDKQNSLQRDLEKQRAAAEQELERERQENEALQAYLDQMSQLILEKNLADSEEGSPARVLAQSRTLTVLESLDDSHRKLNVIRFLNQSKLIVNESPVISLENADLTDIDFYDNARGRSARLTNANFNGAYLAGSQMTGMSLDHAYLRSTGLEGARLEGAILEDTDLTQAQLGSTINRISLGGPLREFEAADLSGADLSHTTLTNADLYKVDMSPLERSSWELQLLRDEGRTNLSGANLSYAYMVEVDLRDTILEGADFTCANLRDADFRGSTGITPEELANQARDLSGATKPDGSPFPQQQGFLWRCPARPVMP